MKKYIVIRFDNLIVGAVFMSTYIYPSAFIVGDDVYDKNGDLTSFEYYIEMLVDDIRNVITDSNQFIESEICYDGDNLYIQKNI
jgi:hypothetical protein